MIHRESWYRESSTAHEVVESLLRYPEGYIPESLWGELLIRIYREGRVPPKLQENSDLLEDLLLSESFSYHFSNGRVPSPLHAFLLDEADLEIEAVSIYLEEWSEQLSLEGKPQELKELEARVDRAIENTSKPYLYDKWILVARLVSWGMGAEEAEAVFESFLGSYPLQGRGRDYESLQDFGDIAEGAFFFLHDSWSSLLEGLGGGDWATGVKAWRRSQEELVYVWSTFASSFPTFPDKAFWIHLHEADTAEEVTQLMGAPILEEG